MIRLTLYYKKLCFVCASNPQDMNARTLPRMTALQMGQWRRLAAQSVQTTRWPQGIKTMETSLSMHTLQVLSSWSCLNCSSGVRSGLTEKHVRWRHLNVTRVNYDLINCVMYTWTTVKMKFSSINVHFYICIKNELRLLSEIIREFIYIILVINLVRTFIDYFFIHQYIVWTFS